MFLCLLILLFILQSGASSRPLIYTGLLFILISLSHSYQNLTPHYYTNDFMGENFNTLLSNSINKFHPALFYLTLVLGTLYRPTGNFTSMYRYSQLSDHLSYNYFTLMSIPIIIFTLSLGS